MRISWPRRQRANRTCEVCQCHLIKCYKISTMLWSVM